MLYRGEVGKSSKGRPQSVVSNTTGRPFFGPMVPSRQRRRTVGRNNGGESVGGADWSRFWGFLPPPVERVTVHTHVRACLLLLACVTSPRRGQKKRLAVGGSKAMNGMAARLLKCALVRSIRRGSRSKESIAERNPSASQPCRSHGV